MDVLFPKVLVVEDDPIIRRLLARTLEPAGYSVREASNGREALELVREDCPHFVITDWRMPEMDGIELCRKLRQMELPHYVFTVLVTARNRSQDLVDALAAGADDFVSKPIVAQEMIARLLTGHRILELEQRLTTLASRDPLTNAFNRRTFYALVEKEWSRSRRYGHPLSCVMIDVDFFKDVNDTHGHLAGDAVLQEIAARLETSTRLSDVVCRYGGEEFCVLMPETDEANAGIWAERCRKTIDDTPIEAVGHSLRITASLGVAQRSEGMESFEALLGQADAALYEAKRQGRNRVELAGGQPLRK